MNHLKWAAWSVVEVEKLDKQQRRNYLKKVRTELAEVGFTLHPGGSTQTPFYQVQRGDRKQTFAGGDAFAKICAYVLIELGEKPDVSGADGGVRRAGDEAEEAAVRP